MEDLGWTGSRIACFPMTSINQEVRMTFITMEDFLKVDMRVGRIIRAEPHPRARKPSIRLWIDFGPEIGIWTSSAALADRYRPEELVGTLVIAVVNFPPKNVAGFDSQVLVLGVPDETGRVVLLRPDAEVPLGGRVF